jgi:hypothetical protein
MLVLYRVLGVAIFGGLILMVVLLPVNTWIAQKQQVLSLLALLVSLLALLVVLLPVNMWIAQKPQVLSLLALLVQISRYEQRVVTLLALLVSLLALLVVLALLVSLLALLVVLIPANTWIAQKQQVCVCVCES